ncbi:MAG: aminotransferase class V-fold PLP-dependent enzyme [Gemmatimonadales bacterium]
MSLSRRRLLVGGTLTAAASALAPVTTFADRLRAPALRFPDFGDWQSVREQFELDSGYVHLGLFYLASHPRPVRAAIEQFRRRLDQNPFLTVERGMFEDHYPKFYDDVTQALGRYTGGDPLDFALTSNTTTGLSVVYHGLPLQPEHEILTTDQDHYVHHEAIRLACERAGATWRKIPIFSSYGAISADEIVDRIRKGIGPKTRVVGITWVHSSSGLRMPVRRIADAIGEINRGRDSADRVLLVVDGVHGIGVEDQRITALGADVFVAGLHKWIFAPRGTGFVWARPEIWATMRPLMASFQYLEEFNAWADERPTRPPNRAAMFSPGGFQAFEHHWAVPAAIDFHEKIGPQRITERIHALNTQMRAGLAKMPHVVIYTPASSELSAGLVCFDVKGLKAQETVSRLLSKKIIASTTPYRVPLSRLACGIMNTPAEVDTALRAVRMLA